MAWSARRERGGLPAKGDGAMGGEAIVERRVNQGAVADDEPSIHDGVSWGERTAPEPSLDGVGVRSGEEHAAQRPHDHVGHRPDPELTDLAVSAKAGCPAARCHELPTGESGVIFVKNFLSIIDNIDNIEP